MSTRKPQRIQEHPVDYGDALAAGLMRAVGEGIVDGDTYDVLLDLGFYQYAYERIRLAGIDTPEVYGVRKESEEYERGQAASVFVREFVMDRPLLVRTLEEESFGRFVADVYVRVEESETPIRDEVEVGGEDWSSLAGILKAGGHDS